MQNLGEKVTSEDATDGRQPSRRRAVVVSGVVEVDLSRHVDRAGGIYDDARYVVDRALRSCPAGADVRVRIGRALYVYDTVLDALADLVINARSLEVIGTDDRGVAYVVPRLRERVRA